MAARTMTELQRVRYWQGQLLASGDLQIQLLVDEELRRLHNREMHGAYGIAIGLILEEDPATGELKIEAETKNLMLTCGMAYDCAGRELIVETDRAVPQPPQFPRTLVIAYDPASIDGIALAWKRAQEVNANREVAIVSLILGKDKNNRDIAKLDPAFRPVVARPVARPRLATGTTIPGETPWQPWRIGETEVGVKVLIDTSAAGFTHVPHYFAEAVAGKPDPNFVPAWFTSIAEASTQGFTLQLMLRRITRASLEILDPRAQVAERPTLDWVVKLDTSNLFVGGDSVARVLPLAEEVAQIKTLTAGGIATLDAALDTFTEPKQMAFGNPPRSDQVETTSDTSSFEITVADPSKFQEGDVVIKLGDTSGTATPARIVSIEDDNTIELAPAITGLAPGDSLGLVKSVTVVTAVSGASVTVASLDDKLVENGLVMFVKEEEVESSPSATITRINTQTKTLELSAELTGLKQSSPLSTVTKSDTVRTVTKVPSEVKVKVKENVKQFRAGDLVAKRFADGTYSPPVRVKTGIKITAKTLTLSGPISGLAKDDTIAAADFRVRATVLEKSVATVVGQPVTTVTVTDSSLFSAPRAYVARIDETLSPSLPVPVKRILTDRMLELNGEIQGLVKGDVIALCSFPTTVKVVQATQPDGSIEVSVADVLREGDVLTALPSRTGLAVVRKVDGKAVWLAGKITGLAVGDDLSVATINGFVNVTQVSSNQVKVVEHKRLRERDFLGEITGWRQARPGVKGVSYVWTATNNQLTLTSLLDGLLIADTLGLADIVPPFLRLRLNTVPDLVPGDEVLLVGRDLLRDETLSVFATVMLVIKPSNLAWLWVQGTPGAFAFRPAKEELTVSVLFVRGSALALIQKQDLFVSWLAVGEPDQMPRACDGVDLLEDPCAQLKE